MTEQSKSYQDAVQVLRSRLNNRWEGVEAEGRDEMVDILRSELGFERDEANDAIDAMIESGVLRYHRPTADTGETPAVPVMPLPNSAGGVVGSTVGAPPVVPFANAGYWQIGREESDEPGRAGQIKVGD